MEHMLPPIVKLLVPMFSFCSRHKNNVSTIGHVTCRIICFHGIAYLDLNHATRKAGVVRPDVLLPTPNRNQSGVQFVLRLIFQSIPAILLPVVATIIQTIEVLI